VEALVRVGGIGVLIFGGHVLLPRLLRESARDTSGEVMMIMSIAIAIVAGVATQALGFSMELGAFLAGFLLASTPFRHHLSGQIAPLRDLFMAVFFTTLGMRLDLETVLENWWIILIAGALMTALKAITIGFTCWAVGATAGMAVAVGAALAQGGEFGLVLLDQSETLGVISATVNANAIAIVVISLMLTPAMLNFGRWWSQRWAKVGCAPWLKRSLDQHVTVARAADAGADAVQHAPRVILAGYGQVGFTVGESLDQAGITFSIIEINPDNLRLAKHEGHTHPAVFGDVTNIEVLEAAGLKQADALILTMPDEPAVLKACALARRQRPDIFIAARMQVQRHSKTAAELGADYIIVEEMEAARAMREAVLKHLHEAGSSS
jgi:monovalent cation:H+ antiporter-2, CPA2 family